MKIYRFKPRHQKNALFIKVLLVVGAIQVAAMLLLGGIMITQALIPQEAEFEAPPPPQENKEPEKKQRQVVLQKNLKRSATQVKRINVPNVNQVNPPELSISLPSGMGGDGSSGIGDISLAGANLQGVKIDLPTMEIFGTKASSDRVFIAFEVSEEVMKDDMGGLDAFNVVKDEIKALVNSLPGTIVFNVMAFDTHAKFNLQVACFQSLVPANPVNKENFSKWIDTINPNPDKVGLWWNDPRRLNQKEPPPPYPTISFHGDGWHRDQVVGRYMVYQAAIESGAGAVWILTREWNDPSKYYMSLGEETEKRYFSQWEKNVKDYERGGKKVGTDQDWQNWIKSTEPARKKAKDWLDNENKRRESKGIPKRVQTDMLALANELKIPYPPKPVFKNDLRPPTPKFKTYNRQTLFAAYEPMLKKYYDERGMPRPKVNIIMLLSRKTEWTQKDSATIRSWARMNGGGATRVLRAGKPVSEYEE